MPAAGHIFDAVVVGAGPAGSAAAGRLAGCGHSVMILECERFPRFHIGESLLPLGNRVFDALGCRERIAAAGFVTKRGAQLRSPCGEHTVLFDFAAQGIDPATTIQVHRAEFDTLLLEHVESLGATRELGRARSYTIDDEGVTLAYLDGAGPSRTVRARAVIDASGRAGFVARHERVRVDDHELQKVAVYAHFKGAARDPGERAGDTRIVALPNLGWLWFIPLQHGVTSVGAVLDLADYRQHERGDLGVIFQRAVQSSPLAGQLLVHAERVSEFAAESGFSYRARRYAGDRWLLAGDAGSFLDPVWSTGVQMALQSGIEAADAVVDGYLRPRARPASAIARYDRRLQRRYRFVRRFVMGFYDPNMRDLFFAPRPYLGIHRAVTRMLAGDFDLGWLNRLRLRLFFSLARLQARFELVPRVSRLAPASPTMERA